MDANKHGNESVLSDKEKFKTDEDHTQHGHAEHGKSELHAKEEIGHMGEKTREAASSRKK